VRLPIFHGMIRMTSPSVRRKSPMSAWRRSTSSTKRLTERLWLSLSAMAVEAATAAEVVTAVTVVEAGVMSAAVMVVAAVAAAAASAFGGAAAVAAGAAVAAAADIGVGGMAIGTGAVGVTSPSFLLLQRTPYYLSVAPSNSGSFAMLLAI